MRPFKIFTLLFALTLAMTVTLPAFPRDTGPRPLPKIEKKTVLSEKAILQFNVAIIQADQPVVSPPGTNFLIYKKPACYGSQTLRDNALNNAVHAAGNCFSESNAWETTPCDFCITFYCYTVTLLPNCTPNNVSSEGDYKVPPLLPANMKNVGVSVFGSGN